MDKNELIKLIISSPSLTEEGNSFKDYLSSLRVNRNELVDGILAAKESSENLSQKKALLIKAKNIQNQTRGKLGELLGRVALTQQTNATDDSLVTDKVVFVTPYGDRRVDVYWEANRIAVETKMGYITNSKSIRNQIEKDAYLVENNIVSSVLWLLIKSGSKAAIVNLDKHRIAYKEGWPL
ncbi:MAG: hypothetical protein HGA97_10480 [Chlorobiaceae bacterium]|nr:hypothetical protein [Chlorobiaceae bacterium]